MERAQQANVFFSQCLNVYSQALLELERLNSNFSTVVDMLLQSNGKVIFTGMGKSGHVCRKAAATFTSTGTPSVFLHPSEASHGDMGIIRADDIVIALSASGATSELRDVIIFARQKSIPTIALTKDLGSFLAKNSTHILRLPDIDEICPNKLAPTTSTICQMAILDALASCISMKKCFKPEQFHLYHPGGKLGSILLEVQQVMATSSELPLVNTTDHLEDTIVEMSDKGFGCCGVVESNGKLVGIYTDGDLRRGISELHNSFGNSISNVMCSSPLSITPTCSVVDAMEFLGRNQISSVFVVNSDFKPIGLFHIKMYAK